MVKQRKLNCPLKVCICVHLRAKSEIRPDMHWSLIPSSWSGWSACHRGPVSPNRNPVGRSKHTLTPLKAFPKPSQGPGRLFLKSATRTLRFPVGSHSRSTWSQLTVRLENKIRIEIFYNLIILKLRCVELKISSNPPTENIARIVNAAHLSSVTINCLVTKIVMNPGSQLSVL